MTTTTTTATIIIQPKAKPKPKQKPKKKKKTTLYLHKGTISGIYSLSGGFAILILTKVGGLLFDRLSTAAPFWILAGFNAVLGGVVLGLGFVGIET